MCIGVDPGIHFGITLLTDTTFVTMWGSLTHCEFPGMAAIHLVHTLIGSQPWEAMFHLLGYHHSIRIEGPAYNERMGQPLLEQVRFGFAYGFKIHYDNVSYMPPMTARKLAFGHGRRAGKDIWVSLNQNAADSIGLAIAAGQECLSLP